MTHSIHFLKHAARLMAIALCTLPALYACDDLELTPANISMVTNTPTVIMSLDGSGETTIDWGDGSMPETFYISNEIYLTFDHTYSSPSAHTIRIYGENITDLDCSNNQLKSLDISNNPALTELSCYNNYLTRLDVSHHTRLRFLECYGNQLTALDVSHNPVLSDLSCTDNQLTALDISHNPALTVLSCSGNQLKSLDASNNTALRAIYCDYNQLSVDGLNSLFRTLHGNTLKWDDGTFVRKYLSIVGNPGAAGCDHSIAWVNEWSVHDGW